MAIPDFQSIMLPFLKFCADGKEQTNQEALDALAQEYGLTEDEQKELLPSGQKCVIDNRVAWARAHITTSRFCDTAKEFAANIDNKIILIDGHSFRLKDF